MEQGWADRQTINIISKLCRITTKGEKVELCKGLAVG